LTPRGGRTDDGTQPVRAPRGTEITAQGWQQEPRCGCWQNNLDPEVAEHPQARWSTEHRQGARDWNSFDAMVAPARPEQDETMLVQSGRPVGVMQTHEWAPRVLIAQLQLVGDWATGRSSAASKRSA